MIDTNALNAELIHAVKLMVEAILAAGFVFFCWLISGPAIRGGGRR